MLGGCHGTGHCGLIARIPNGPEILSSMLKPQNQRYARLTLTSRTEQTLRPQAEGVAEDQHPDH